MSSYTVLFAVANQACSWYLHSPNGDVKGSFISSLHVFVTVSLAVFGCMTNLKLFISQKKTVYVMRLALNVDDMLYKYRQTTFSYL